MAISGRAAALAAWFLVGCSGAESSALFAERASGGSLDEDAGKAPTSAPTAVPEQEAGAGGAPGEDAVPPTTGGEAGAAGGAKLSIGTGGAASSGGATASGGIVGVANGGVPTAGGGAPGTGGIPHISIGGSTSAGGTQAAGGQPTTGTGGAPACDPAVMCAAGRCSGVVACGNGASIDCGQMRCSGDKYCGGTGYCASFFDGLGCDSGGQFFVTIVTGANTGTSKWCLNPPTTNPACHLEDGTVANWDCSSRCAYRNGSWVCS